MKDFLMIGLLLFAASVVLPAAPTAERVSATCPLDSTSAGWTGEFEQIEGKTWYVMKCQHGHRFLAEKP